MSRSVLRPPRLFVLITAVCVLVFLAALRVHRGARPRVATTTAGASRVRSNHPYPPPPFSMKHYFVHPRRRGPLEAEYPLPVLATSLAVDGEHNRLYTYNSDELDVVDARSNRLLKVVPFDTPDPTRSGILSVDPAGRRLFMAEPNMDGKILDTGACASVGRLPVRAGSPVVIDAEFHRLYAASAEDVVSEDESGRGPDHRLAPETGYLALDPAARRLYITQTRVHTLLIFDTRTLSLVKTISFPKPRRAGDQGPIAVAVNPRTERVYAAAGDAGGDVVVIGERTDRVIDRLQAGPCAANVAVDPVTDRVFVTESSEPALHVFDGRTDRELCQPLELVDSPRGIYINPQAGLVYLPLPSHIVAVLKEVG